MAIWYARFLLFLETLSIVGMFLCPAWVRADHDHGAVNPPSYRPNKCLVGDKHKESPGPEDETYKTCFLWKDAACCTAEFTQQLNAATVTNIDGFHWNRCGDLSPACQRFFVEIECFYRCSPHVSHWAGLFPSSLNRLPVCQDYCDSWFAACADDMTCATNWITDWVTASNGSNFCKSSSPCSSFRTRYSNGASLCGHLWGQSFTASNDSSACLLPWFNSTQGNPNVAAVQKIFNVGSSSHRGSTASLVVNVFLCFTFLSAFLLIL